MINGAHVVVYSKDAAADRDFFRDVLRLPAVDAGHGWLIFALPPSEAAFHPADDNSRHELYLMCDDVRAAIAELAASGVACGPVAEERWGLRSSIRLPGGGEIGLYEPRHPTAIGQASGQLADS
jgi:catechol 2,3-dioxygenase-like lactoylglutathione lyase family enzyme